MVGRASLPAHRADANVAFLAFCIAESLVEFLSGRTVRADVSGATSMCILPASIGTTLYLSEKSCGTFVAADSAVPRVGTKVRGDQCFKSCCICLAFSPIVECVDFFASCISELTNESWPGQNDVYELLYVEVTAHQIVNGILESHRFALDSSSEAGLELRGEGIANDFLEESLNEF